LTCSGPRDPPAWPARGLLPERHHVDLVALALEHEIGQLDGLLLVQQVGAHPDELGDDLVVHLVVDDDRLLGRTDYRGVEGLGDQHVDHHALEVGRLVHVARRVARTH